MNLKELFNHFDANSDVLLMPLEADSIALALTSALAQLEAENPGLVVKHGWARLDDLQAFTKVVLQATQATTPDGLH